MSLYGVRVMTRKVVDLSYENEKHTLDFPLHGKVYTHIMFIDWS